MSCEVRDVVCDYGVYENGELKLILNSRRIAEKIVQLLKEDERNHRELNPSERNGGRSMIKSESIIPLLTVCANSENAGCAQVGKQSIEVLNRQKAEIEQLRERISYLEKSIECSREEYNRLLQKLQHAQSEEIKEFAERLKRKFGIADCIVTVDNNDIDEIIKEMTEEK